MISGSARSTTSHSSIPTSRPRYNHVDAACIYFVQDPGRYDVIVTDNMFGDIITDLGGAIAGGHRPSGDRPTSIPPRTGPSLFEPVHGSAPDIAGTGQADPRAAIMSAAMMLEFLGEVDAASHEYTRRSTSPTTSPAPPRRSVQQSAGGSSDAVREDREDLDGRRAGAVGRGSGPRAHAQSPLRLRRVRRYPDVRDGRRSGGVPPHRPHRAPARLRQAHHDGDPVLARGARRSVQAHRARERTRLLLRAPDRLPRVRRDRAQPAAVPGERVDRGVAVGRVPRRGEPRQGRADEGLVVAAHGPEHQPGRGEGHRDLHQLEPGQGRGGAVGLRRGDPAQHAGVRGRVHGRERLHRAATAC